VRQGSAQALSVTATTTDHRRRLLAAMVEAASQHGYLGATVSRVAALAGVSRATYYQHFGCREECFLEAYRVEAGRLRDAVRDAAAATPPALRPEAVLEVLVGALAENPAVARVLLVEALAAPAPARAEHEQLIRVAEELIARHLDSQGTAFPIQIPAAALLGGVGEVLASRVISAPSEDLATVRDGLLRWIDSYRLPAGSRPLPQRRWGDLGRFARRVASRAAEQPPLLPRGRSALPRGAAAEERRRRLLDATARIAARSGYSQLTVAQIAAAARVPRTAFYSHFEDKQEAVRAAQIHGLQEAMGVVAMEYSAAASWPERVRRAMEAFLANVGSKPDYARLDFVESFAAGPAATRRRHESQMAFALFLEEGYRQRPSAGRLPRLCSEALGGAMFGMMRKLVVENQIERMPSLLAPASYTVLAPFIGPQKAAAQVQAWTRGAR
jgi:AcrR family transcriptional regulator